MLAVIYTHYGPPDSLQLTTVAQPSPADSEILVKVHAATVNRTDNATIQGIPFFARIITGLLKPKKQTPGSEFAGEVIATGNKVKTLKIDDRVFGFEDTGCGSQAQFLVIDESMALTIPDNLTYEQMAPVSEGAHYAQNFINKVNIESGMHILVNGATGAIGSAAVQFLKAHDVHVTAVCAGTNAELVKSLGADRVIDFTTADFTQEDTQYDYVFDTVGKSSFFKCRRILKPGGVYISSDLGYLAQNMFLPMITPLLKPLLGNRKTIFPFPVDIPFSLNLVKQLIEAGKFRAVIDRTYPLEKIIEAYQYVKSGQKIGTVVISIDHDD